MHTWRQLLSIAVLSLTGAAGCGPSRSDDPSTRGQPIATHAGRPQRTVQFEKRTFAYAVFVPTAYDGNRLLPAILLVHGGGGNGPDFLNIWKAFAEAHGIILVAPTLPPGAAVEAMAARLFPVLIEAVRKEWKLDAGRVYLFGYSAGGYETFDAALLDAGSFAAAAVFAAVIEPDHDWTVHQAPRKTGIAIYIGDGDQFFPLAQARRTRDLLLSNGFAVHYIEIAHHDHDYRSVSDWVNADAWTFLSSYSLAR
jgi:poly(3-hydroxybutyrate) depolymerase